MTQDQGHPASQAWVRLQGSGPVALACALFMVRQGIPAHRIALDAKPREIPAALNHRILALSEGSLQLLDRVCARPVGGAIRTVDVSMRGHWGSTTMRADELGVAALGCVVRYPELLKVLRQAAAAQAWHGQPTSDPQALSASDPHARPAAQSLHSMDSTAASGSPNRQPMLLIHAEGDPGEDAQVRTFDQAALLLEVNAPQAPAQAAGSAHEKFTAQGPLALLPLAEPGRWSVVWCDTPEAGERRLHSDEASLSHELQHLFGHRLGPLHILGPRHLAALVRKARTETVQDQDQAEIWIGNAAQALHPVAGQGLNLGLRDAFELAQCLGEAWRMGQPARSVTTRWARQRQRDRRGLIALTDLMARSFTWPAARPVQSIFLGGLEIIGPARRALARTLMFGLR